MADFDGAGAGGEERGLRGNAACVGNAVERYDRVSCVAVVGIFGTAAVGWLGRLSVAMERDLRHSRKPCWSIASMPAEDRGVLNMSKLLRPQKLISEVRIELANSQSRLRLSQLLVGQKSSLLRRSGR